MGTNVSYHFGSSVLSPPNKSRAVLRGSKANSTRRCLSFTFPLNSFMFEWRELLITSAWGRGSVGPRSSRSSTLAAISSCSSCERSFHQVLNSSVSSTSHDMLLLFHIGNSLSMEYRSLGITNFRIPIKSLDRSAKRSNEKRLKRKLKESQGCRQLCGIRNVLKQLVFTRSEIRCSIRLSYAPV